jgi:hypothetical protein
MFEELDLKMCLLEEVSWWEWVVWRMKDWTECIALDL